MPRAVHRLEAEGVLAVRDQEKRVVVLVPVAGDDCGPHYRVGDDAVRVNGSNARIRALPLNLRRRD